MYSFCIICNIHIYTHVYTYMYVFVLFVIALPFQRIRCGCDTTSKSIHRGPRPQTPMSQDSHIRK